MNKSSLTIEKFSLNFFSTKEIVSIFFFWLLCNNTFAQHEADNWYFGNNAGLCFSSGTAVPLTNGALLTREGCATISDAGGNLLFYTDGQTVWNKNHVPMENGTGLLGNASATQSGIIVPRPGSTSLYYIFTVPQATDNDGLKYSVVDMTYNSGLGKVTQKNIPLITPVAEKVTAVRHSNNTDIWVITHGRNNNTFYTYLVTSSGINTTPLTTNVGSIHGPELSKYVGYMKASPGGNYIALAAQSAISTPTGFFEVFSFDNSTGAISNPITFTNFYQAYGVEFSPDESRLYLGRLKDPHAVYQADLNAGSPSAIINSVVLIGNPSADVGALQVGNDGKIYITYDYSPSLDVIANPNNLGTACNYQSSAISLGGKQGRLGLPTFIQSYFTPRSFNYNGVCLGQITQFTIINTTGIDSAHWNFGDPASGVLNTASALSPGHIYTSAGVFNVSLTVYNSGVGATSTQNVEIFPLPVPDLGSDLTLCGQNQYILDAGAGYASYQWASGQTSQTITVTSSGVYGVTVTTSHGCSGYDQVSITLHPAPGSKAILHN